MNRKQRRRVAKLGQTASDPPGATAAAVRRLGAGREYHQAGRLAEAEACYRQVLAVQPDHAQALQPLVRQGVPEKPRAVSGDPFF